MQTHEEAVKQARSQGTAEQLFACDLVAEALKRTGVEVRHVILSLHVDGGIEMCFRSPLDVREHDPSYGWKAVGCSATPAKIAALLFALAECTSLSDVEMAIKKSGDW